MITCKDRDEHASSMNPRIITIVVIIAGPMEVRGPLRLHTLQWPKAGPAYLNRFIHNTTSLLEPLHQLLKNDIHFSHDLAFERIKVIKVICHIFICDAM